MHMNFDDQTNTFSSVLSDLKAGRHVQVFIPTSEPAQDFAIAYDRFRRLSDAADYVFEMISSGLEGMPCEPALEAVSLLSNTLIESRFDFGQKQGSMSAEEITVFEEWMEKFSAMVADLKAMAPNEVFKQMYCHHLVVGEDIQCFYRFQGFDNDVMVTGLPMNYVHNVIDRMVIMQGNSTGLSASLH